MCFIIMMRRSHSQSVNKKVIVETIHTLVTEAHCAAYYRVVNHAELLGPFGDRQPATHHLFFPNHTARVSRLGILAVRDFLFCVNLMLGKCDSVRHGLEH